MDIKAIIYIVINLIQVATPIVVGIALLSFFWAIFQSFGRLDTVEQRADIRKTLLWSVVAIFVVVTLAGLVAIVSTTFSLGNAPTGGGAGSGVLNQGTSGTGGSSFFPSARSLPFFRVGGGSTETGGGSSVGGTGGTSDTGGGVSGGGTGWFGGFFGGGGASTPQP